MNILTSNAHFRQRVIKRSYKYSVTEAAKYYRISHRIKVATSRHNGKVERQHRTDEKRFYKKMKCIILKMEESNWQHTI